jgi:hypothetical protein
MAKINHYQGRIKSTGPFIYTNCLCPKASLHGRPRGSGRALNVQNAKTHCALFGNGFRSSNGIQYAASLLRNLRAISIKNTCGGEGDYQVAKRPPERLSTPLLLANFNTGVEASNGTLKVKQLCATVCFF